MEVGFWQEKIATRTASAQEIIYTILQQAVRSGVSDIHIEPMDQCVRVRFRLDGVLFPACTLPAEQLEKITARIKIMSALDIANKRLPQDGRLVWNEDKQQLDIRVSTMPTIRGEKTVLRLLSGEDISLELNRLGFNEPAVEHINLLLKHTRGLILCTGPTGSGKTTTLYAALRQINSESRSIATMEDPVEYKVSGLSQSQINRKSGLYFLNGLRALLRQDPDILVIGEIRDKETAEIAVHAALTGHLVFSTLHVGSAFEAPLRLMDLGIESYLLADALLGIISQRLARCLCVSCRRAIEDKGHGVFSHAGCSDCYYTGYKGRIALGEVVLVGKSLRQAIRTCENVTALQEAGRQDGAWFMKQSIHEALQQGITDGVEVQRIYDE